jgi:hypothetical protein
MGIVTYGNVIPAYVDLEDIEIHFSFQRNFSQPPSALESLDVRQFLSQVKDPNGDEPAGGVYDFTIPAAFHSARGLGNYYFYIQPKKMRASISEIGYLDGTDIKGIVVDLSPLPQFERAKMGRDGNLVGYSLLYLENDRDIKQGVNKIISANYRVEPVSSALNAEQGSPGVRFRPNPSSQLVFLAVSPSSDFGANSDPYSFIGYPTQKILIHNTYFTPQQIHIELTDIDERVLFDGIYGDQSFNYETGVRTFYDREGNIAYQKNEFTTKNPDGSDLRKVSVLRDEIDANETI